ncbi:MAG TPA: MFS transporter [Sphingobium sp.]|uniref:spinster family MFS transporter n=1 Tax=Sphingobium sp. TaxID=1912891 RepID=UPI002ED564E3
MSSSPLRIIPRDSWVFLIILTLIYSTSWVDRSVLIILAEPIRKDLELSDSQMGLLTGLAFSLVYSLSGVAVARLADTRSRKTIIAASASLFGLMTTICGFAQGFLLLALARMGVAVAESGVSPAAYSMMSDKIPLNGRGTAIAIYSLGISIGTFIGLTGGGWIEARFDWRTAFVVMGLPGFALGLLFFVLVKEPERGALEEAGPSAGEAPQRMGFSKSLAFLAERPVFLAIALGFAFLTFGHGAFEVWAPTYLMRVKGIDMERVAIMSGLLQGAITIISSLAAGLTADRLSVSDLRWYIWVPLVGTAIAVPAEWLFFVGGSDRPWLYYLIAELGIATTSAPLLTVGQMLLPPQFRAFGMSIMLLLLNLIGTGGGPSLVGAMSDLLRPLLGMNSLAAAILSAQVGTIAGVVFLWWASAKMSAGRFARNAQPSNVQ